VERRGATRQGGELTSGREKSAAHPEFLMDRMSVTPDSAVVALKTNKLIKDLKAATQAAKTLASQIAEGIRNERRAGLPYTASDRSRRNPTKATGRKTR
jgi:hypothetical protein